MFDASGNTDKITRGRYRGRYGENTEKPANNTRIESEKKSKEDSTDMYDRPIFNYFIRQDIFIELLSRIGTTDLPGIITMFQTSDSEIKVDILATLIK